MYIENLLISLVVGVLAIFVEVTIILVAILIPGFVTVVVIVLSKFLLEEISGFPLIAFVIKLVVIVVVGLGLL